MTNEHRIAAAYEGGHRVVVTVGDDGVRPLHLPDGMTLVILNEITGREATWITTPGSYRLAGDRAIGGTQ